MSCPWWGSSGAAKLGDPLDERRHSLGLQNVNFTHAQELQRYWLESTSVRCLERLLRTFPLFSFQEKAGVDGF